MKRQRKLPEFYLIFEMKPGMGKDFIQDHNYNFMPFIDIEDLFSFSKRLFFVKNKILFFIKV